MRVSASTMASFALHLFDDVIVTPSVLAVRSLRELEKLDTPTLALCEHLVTPSRVSRLLMQAHHRARPLRRSDSARSH